MNAVRSASPSLRLAALFAALLALPFVALPVGCSEDPRPPSGEDAGSVDAEEPFTSDTACGKLATAQCELLARCFTAFNRLGKEDCVAAQTTLCVKASDKAAQSVREGRAKLDEGLLNACVDRMTNAACPAALPPTAPAIATRAFEDCTADKLFVGNVDDGSECRNTSECKAGSRCVIFGGACGGACTPYSGIGEPCSGVCNPATSYCDMTSNFCVALKKEGEGCTDPAQCEAGLDCRGSSCLPGGPASAPCGFSWTRLPYCAAGLACDVVPYVDMNPGACADRKNEGEACLYHWSCKPGLVCAGMDWSPFPDKAAGPGKCAKPGAEGQACTPSAYAIYVGDECGPGLSCDEKLKKCIKRPHNSEACDINLQNCIGENVYCKPDSAGGICGGPPGIGEACLIDLGSYSINLPCRDGYCDTTSQVCAAANAQEGAPCTTDAQCLTGRCVAQQDHSLKCGKRCGSN